MSEEKQEMPDVGTPGHVDHGDSKEVAEADTAPQQVTMKDLVTQEVQRLVTISRHYQSKIEESKTKPKKEYFLKKLRKNNVKLADMIIRFEQMNKTGDTSGH